MHGALVLLRNVLYTSRGAVEETLLQLSSRTVRYRSTHLDFWITNLDDMGNQALQVNGMLH